MRRLVTVGVILLLISITELGFGQSQAQTTPSLGDLARQLKSDRAKATQKPRKTFTNDNLPARPAESGLTVAAGMGAGEEATSASSTGEPSDVHDEKYYRTTMSGLRAQKEVHERQLDVLQQKLSQGQFQYYPDPNKQLMQEYSRGDINKLTGEIEKKKQEVAADEKAMEDLRDQLRRESKPPGWVR